MSKHGDRKWLQRELAMYGYRLKNLGDMFGYSTSAVHKLFEGTHPMPQDMLITCLNIVVKERQQEDEVPEHVLASKV